MLTIQAKVSCDEFGCVAHEAVTLKVFQGEVLVARNRIIHPNDEDGIALTQFELVKDEHIKDWTVNFSGDRSLCPEHTKAWHQMVYGKST